VVEFLMNPNLASLRLCGRISQSENLPTTPP
jgi:hypothetical protein